MRKVPLILLAALAAGPAAAQSGFRSPDNAIHCLWSDDGPVCEVNWRTNHRPYGRRECGPMFEGVSYGLRATGRTVIGCNMGDSVRNDSYPVLAYGARRQRHGTTCVMGRDGLRCENRSRRGFRLHRGREEMF